MCTVTWASVMPGCTSCRSTGECTSCSEGTPIDSGCTNVSGCSQVTYSNGVSQCVACSGTVNNTLYNTNTGSCLCTADPSCASCTNLLQCGTCSNSYYLPTNGTACQPCNTLCTTCSSGTTCESCPDGQYPSDAFCTVCPTGCTLCSNATNCSECDGGYKMRESQCFRIETGASTTDKWFVVAMCLSSLGLFGLTAGLCYWLRGEPGMDEEQPPTDHISKEAT